MFTLDPVSPPNTCRESACEQYLRYFWGVYAGSYLPLALLADVTTGAPIPPGAEDYRVLAWDPSTRGMPPSMLHDERAARVHLLAFYRLNATFVTVHLNGFLRLHAQPSPRRLTELASKVAVQIAASQPTPEQIARYARAKLLRTYTRWLPMLTPVLREEDSLNANDVLSVRENRMVTVWVEEAWALTQPLAHQLVRFTQCPCAVRPVKCTYQLPPYARLLCCGGV